MSVNENSFNECSPNSSIATPPYKTSPQYDPNYSLPPINPSISIPPGNHAGNVPGLGGPGGPNNNHLASPIPQIRRPRKHSTSSQFSDHGSEEHGPVQNFQQPSHNFEIRNKSGTGLTNPRTQRDKAKHPYERPAESIKTPDGGKYDVKLSSVSNQKFSSKGKALVAQKQAKSILSSNVRRSVHNNEQNNLNISDSENEQNFAQSRSGMGRPKNPGQSHGGHGQVFLYKNTTSMGPPMLPVPDLSKPNSNIVNKNPGVSKNINLPTIHDHNENQTDHNTTRYDYRNHNLNREDSFTHQNPQINQPAPGGGPQRLAHGHKKHRINSSGGSKEKNLNQIGASFITHSHIHGSHGFNVRGPSHSPNHSQGSPHSPSGNNNPSPLVTRYVVHQNPPTAPKPPQSPPLTHNQGPVNKNLPPKPRPTHPISTSMENLHQHHPNNPTYNHQIHNTETQSLHGDSISDYASEFISNIAEAESIASEPGLTFGSRMPDFAKLESENDVTNWVWVFGNFYFFSNSIWLI